MSGSLADLYCTEEMVAEINEANADAGLGALTMDACKHAGKGAASVDFSISLLFSIYIGTVISRWAENTWRKADDYERVVEDPIET